MTSSHVYEVRPRKDHRGVNLISDALPFCRLSYGGPNATRNAIDYAKHRRFLLNDRDQMHESWILKVKGLAILKQVSVCRISIRGA
jgi:hypothetical protein